MKNERYNNMEIVSVLDTSVMSKDDLEEYKKIKKKMQEILMIRSDLSCRLKADKLGRYSEDELLKLKIQENSILKKYEKYFE